MPDLAVDLPYLNTADRDAAVAFAARAASAERVLIDHPDQLRLGVDYRTAAGGLTYTWPTLVQVCTRLLAGAADVVLCLAGRRRAYDPKPAVAAAVFNTFAGEQFDRLGRQQMLVGADDRLVYRLASAGTMSRGGPRPAEVMAAVFEAGREGGFDLARAFGPVGKVDLAFSVAAVTSPLPLPVAPAVIVRPYPTDGRLRVRPAVRVGDAVVDGRFDDGEPSRTRYPWTWAEPAADWMREVAARLVESLPILAAVRLPGRHPEDLTPPLVRWLKGRGVVRPMAVACARRLTSGQFPGGQTPEFAAAVRLGAAAEWTAADLLLAIAGTVARYPGRTEPILALGRVGFDLAVGAVTPMAL